MENLVKAEAFKLIKASSFWLLLILSLLMGVLYGISPLAGYVVCMTKLMPDSFSAILICIFAVSFICSEFSNRTLAGGTFCKVTRQKIFLAKALIFSAGTFPIVLLSAIAATIISTIRNGFGQEWNAAIMVSVTQSWVSCICWILLMDSCVLLTSSLIRDKIGTFGASMTFVYAIMSLESSKMGIRGSFGNTIIICILKTAILFTVAMLIFTKKDLE